MTPPAASPLWALVLLAPTASAGVEDLVVGPSSDSSVHPYVAFSFGFTDMADSQALGSDLTFDNGFSLGGAVGIELDDFLGGIGLGLEVEALYAQQQTEDGILSPTSSLASEFTSFSVFFNALLQLDLSDTIALYGGGGVGIATLLELDSRADMPSDFDVVDQTAFTWQGKAGLRWRMTETLSWTLGYRHYATEDLETEDGFLGQRFDLENAADVVEIGARWDP